MWVTTAAVTTPVRSAHGCSDGSAGQSPPGTGAALLGAEQESWGVPPAQRSSKALYWRHQGKKKGKKKKKKKLPKATLFLPGWGGANAGLTLGSGTAVLGTGLGSGGGCSLKKGAGMRLWVNMSQCWARLYQLLCGVVPSESLSISVSVSSSCTTDNCLSPSPLAVRSN